MTIRHVGAANFSPPGRLGDASAGRSKAATACVDRAATPNGFTLIEVLVALVVLGLLMVGLAQGIRAGIALRQAQSHRLKEIADLDSTMRALRLLLSNLPTQPQGTRLIASEDGKLFVGEADRVSFVGELPSGLGLTRRADMTLRLSERRLVLSWRPHRHERPLTTLPPPTETELLAGVNRLELAYWGSPGKGRPAAWQTQWESPVAPELVRLRLAFAEGNPRRWPDLIVAPR